MSASRKPAPYPGIATELRQAKAALADLLRDLAWQREEIDRLNARISRAVEVLNEAPDIPLTTEVSKRQASAVLQANQRAWVVLVEGRDPPSRRNCGGPG